MVNKKKRIQSGIDIEFEGTDYLELVLKKVEEQAKEILKENSDPDELLSTEMILCNVEKIRQYIRQNNAAYAVSHTLLMLEIVDMENMEVIEPHFLRGITVLEAAKKSGEGRREQIKEERTPEWERWQEEADAIRKRITHREPSKLELAQKIKHNLSLNETVRTIRNRIK